MFIIIFSLYDVVWIFLTNAESCLLFNLTNLTLTSRGLYVIGSTNLKLLQLFYKLQSIWLFKKSCIVFLCVPFPKVKWIHPFHDKKLTLVIPEVLILYHFTFKPNTFEYRSDFKFKINFQLSSVATQWPLILVVIYMFLTY